MSSAFQYAELVALDERNQPLGAEGVGDRKRTRWVGADVAAVGR